MLIPPSTVSFAPASQTLSSILPLSSGVDHGPGSGLELRQWSSLIGIVTAIIGNVLISFALNTQRYAHIRIDRESEKARPSWKHGKRKSGGPRDYGTQQTEIAEERARVNLTAPANGEGLGNGQQKETSNAGEMADEEEEANETDPLQQSFQSDRTLTSVEKSESYGDRKSYLRSPYWWAGIVMMTVGEAGNFLAYGFAPASIVSPLGVVALVSNCVIAPFMLKERFRQRDFWGVLVAIAGAVTVVLSAKTEEKKMGPNDLWDAIWRWEFLTYLGISGAVILALMWASGKYGQKSILIDVGLVGLFGGYTALSTKGVASLLSDTLWRTLTFPITYVLVAILILTALMQIRYVNRALQRFDSTQVIPTQFVLFTLSVIIGSAVLYRDFESATPERVGKFIAGCALTFFGVYLITSGRARGDDEEDDEEEDEEGLIGLVDEERYQDAAMNGDGAGDDGARRKLQLTTSFDGAKPESRHFSRPDEDEDEDDRLHTPRRRESATSSSAPSIAVTPSPSFQPESSTPQDPILTSNPRLSSSERLVDTPASNPSLTRLRSTQSTNSPSRLDTSALSTPPNQPPNLLLRSPSAPGYPETAVQGSTTTSPPKADPLPQARPSIDDRTRFNRNSISGRLLPGPFLSPLSSGLSAVVADSLRRGEGTPSSRRRLGGALRRARSSRVRYREDGTDTSGDGAADSDARRGGGGGGDGQGQAQQQGSEESQRQTKSRMRSLSDTWGGWLGSKRWKRDGNGDADAGEEGGAEQGV